MILLFIAALLRFQECTAGGASNYGNYKDLLSDLKYVSGYDDKIGQKDIVIPYIVDKKDVDDKKDDTWDYDNRKDDNWDYDVQRDNDGWKEYIVTNKYDDKGYKYGGFDKREYDYVRRCDISQQDCKDGKDCYDKANDRNEYDKCKDQYGDEGRYYDIDDRYSGNRYRSDNDQNRYDKECYDNSKGRDDYEICKKRYNSRDGYDKDCYEHTKNREDYDKCRQYYRRCRNNNRNYRYNDNDWKYDRNCYNDDRNLVGIGKNDREDQLIRPCALDDRQCIRKYLARNSKCKPAYGPIPDPLYLKRSALYLPFVNLTIIRTRLRVTGLASIKISEFYVNKDTKNLVIALDFQNLNKTSPRAFFRYKRTAKESIVLSDYFSAEYKSGTFTAVIPKIPHLRLDLAEVHGDIDDMAPSFIIGPKAIASTDPDVVASVAKLLSDLPTATQEAFLFQTQLLTAIYIQENLCDFGLKLISI